ncbi:MAG: hypothetical protein NTY09_06900, partial [bacterium]|nr:hypothetical protein [bacterium]
HHKHRALVVAREVAVLVRIRLARHLAPLAREIIHRDAKLIVKLLYKFTTGVVEIGVVARNIRAFPDTPDRVVLDFVMSGFYFFVR